MSELPTANAATTARVARSAMGRALVVNTLAAVEYQSATHGTVGLVDRQGAVIVRYSWRLEGAEVVLGDAP